MGFTLKKNLFYFIFRKKGKKQKEAKLEFLGSSWDKSTVL